MVLSVRPAFHLESYKSLSRNQVLEQEHRTVGSIEPRLANKTWLITPLDAGQEALEDLSPFCNRRSADMALENCIDAAGPVPRAQRIQHQTDCDPHCLHCLHSLHGLHNCTALDVHHLHGLNRLHGLHRRSALHSFLRSACGAAVLLALPLQPEIGQRLLASCCPSADPLLGHHVAALNQKLSSSKISSGTRNLAPCDLRKEQINDAANVHERRGAEPRLESCERA